MISLVLAPEPDSTTTGLAWIHRVAQKAEAALFDAIIAPLPSAHVPAESSTLLASLATDTDRIGLVAEVSTYRVAPYNQARRLSTLDHMSQGRAGWILARDEPADRAAEFAHVLRKLWESWAPDAVRADTEAGIYVDFDLLQPIQHTGQYFTVGGPLNLPRSPQVHPPLLGDDVIVRENADVAEDGVYLLRLGERDLDVFVREVVPRVQDEGVFRTQYETSTLRGHLGLAEVAEGVLL